MNYFLAGFGIGVACGMLFAPKSGTETRGYIADKAGEGTDYVKNQSRQLKETATSLFDKGKDAVKNQTDKIQDMVGSAVSSSSPREVYQR